jgi:PKHD-type hydroxylase
MDHLTDSPRLDLGLSERVSRQDDGWFLDTPTRELWAWADAFTADECDSIIEIATRRPFERAETLGRTGQHKRNLQIRFLRPSAETDWVFRRMTDVTKFVNQYFEFDLTIMNEGIQFTRYESPGGKYDWHTDYGPDMLRRKLSLTVQLTDPDEYEGGELELNPIGDPVTMDRVRGRVYAFPSYTLHRVKPMVTGTCHSLVVWVAGPAFR